MMVMADAYGADARLVAFMQYVRAVMVAIVASIIARFWVHAPAVASAAPAVWFAPIHALPFFRNAVPRSCSDYSRPHFPHSGRNIPDTHVPRCGSTIQRSCRNRIAKLAAGGQLFTSWLDDWLAVYPGNSCVCHPGFTENDSIF
jgi:Transition state regulatory protein AbrB